MEFKGTKAKWEYTVTPKNKIGVLIGENGRFLHIGTIYEDDCDVPTCCKIEEHANAELIAEAGNIRQQIPFSLTELKKQRDELLEFLKNHYRYLNLRDQKEAEKLINEAAKIN